MKKILLLILFYNSIILSQWNPTGGPNAQVIYSLHLTGSNLFAATYEGVYLSTTNGETWILKNNGMGAANRKIYTLIEINNKLIAGTDSGMFVSTNYGEMWIAKNSGLPVVETGFIHKLIPYNSNTIFAGTEAGVFISSNYGESWAARNTGLTNLHIYSFTIKQNKLFAGSESKVFVSTNEGLSWNSVSAGIPNGFSCDAMGTDGTNLYTGLCCGGGLYISTNEGTLWQKIAGMPSVNTFLYTGNKMLSGSADGVMYSTDGGFTWTAFNTGLQYLNTTAFAKNSSTLFAGVENIVWRRPVEQLTGLEPISAETPSGFKLHQNYPNPFNPSTKIKFDLPKSNLTLSGAKGLFVKLVVYNVPGKQAASLFEGRLQPGTYEVEWYASDFPSGVYFYKIETPSFTQTRKMILLK